MRTTLVLDDGLIKRAKRVAVERGLTLSAVVNEALRTALIPPAAKKTRFVMPTFGASGGKRQVISVAQIKALRDEGAR